MYVSNCWDSGSVGHLQFIQPLSKGTEQKEKTCCQQKSLNSSLNLFCLIDVNLHVVKLEKEPSGQQS